MTTWVGAQALFVATFFACTSVDLYSSELRYVPVPVDPVPVDTTATINGRYCVEDPYSETYPVKIMLVIDDSGSMAGTDSDYNRLQAARDLVEAVTNNEGVYVGVTRFRGGTPDILTDPAFTDDRTLLDVALAREMHEPSGGTPYVSTLSLVKSAIEADFAVDPQAGKYTRYVVVFLSDGSPNESNDEVITAIQGLKGLEGQTPGPVEVTIHTALLNTGDLSSTWALMQEMARIGEGQAKNYSSGEQLDFRDFDFSAITIDFTTVSSILVTNMTARLSGGEEALQPDSDADAIIDAVELREGTDPQKRDTDDDGCSDITEAVLAWDAVTPGWDTSPQHCRCDNDADRFDDDDNDYLTNCEEYNLETSTGSADSDVFMDGQTFPDNMIDSLELYYRTSRLMVDDAADNDSDGWSNLTELRRHTDPGRTDDTYRDAFAYRYDYVHSDGASITCFEFQVSNVGLVDTLPADGRGAGDNLVLLYYVQAPQTSEGGYVERQVMYTDVIVPFDPAATEPQVVTVEADAFVRMAK